MLLRKGVVECCVVWSCRGEIGMAVCWMRINGFFSLNSFSSSHSSANIN